MSKTRLLYVEDYPVVQEMYVDVLRKQGFDIDVASDGKEALAKMAGHTYDVILLDLLLPHVTGAEVLKQYRTKKGKGKVVILTDFDEPKMIAAVKKLGFDNFWMKVDNPPHLLAERLERLLKQNKG